VQLDGSDKYNANLGTIMHDELRMSNVTLNDCLKFAYSISNDIQIEGPDWIRDKSIRYEVVARSAPDTPRAEMLLMLRQLLAERFKIAMHHDQKPRSYLALTISKKGLKMPAVAEDAPNPSQKTVGGRILSERMQMSTLVLLLSRFTGQPVVDQTGLEGFFAVDLEWTPESLTPAAAQQGPSVYSALPAQLGLKLESRKGPLDILLVDRAEKTPTAN
jgi:uncharacterized protein (TIGR03435 family)